MVTDILLLDLFNTFGLPTSTTVSIVFELLGAATAVSFFKVYNDGGGIQEIGNYLNGSSALLIIAGIFLSIGIAFVVGAIVQFVSRLLFSFHYEKRLTYVGGIWSGIALSGLTYFLLFKGVSGASFVSEEFITWVKDNTLMLLLGAAIFWTIVMQTLASVFKINILRLVVLFGTFSLAMAFAGNDLVNFIGVPIAGLESYQIWSQSGIPADAYNMEILQQPVRTNSMLLIIAGGVMIITLWFSKKARSVTETEVNLGRDGSTYERFTPNALARSIVRNSILTMRNIIQVVPDRWKKRMKDNYKEKRKSTSWDAPAFDLVRASVNLTMAGILISFATSLRLPLSTTYVSFMVAMGTSLADRAWGRNSAVYRISGVLSVIGGWFMTAIIAFMVAGTIAGLMVTFDVSIIFIILPIVAAIIFYTFRLHKRKLKRKESREKTIDVSQYHVSNYLDQSINDLLLSMGELTRQSIHGMINEDNELLNLVEKKLKSSKQNLEDWNGQLYRAIKSGGQIKNGVLGNYIKCYDLQQDMMQSLSWLVKACINHVRNSHEPPTEAVIHRMKGIVDRFSEYQQFLLKVINQQLSQESPSVKSVKKEVQAHINKVMGYHIESIQGEKVDDLTGKLLLGVLLEIKDMTAISARVVQLHSKSASKLG